MTDSDWYRRRAEVGEVLLTLHGPEIESVAELAPSPENMRRLALTIGGLQESCATLARTMLILLDELERKK